MAYGRASTPWTVDDGFDLDGFLGQPLVARVATLGRTGPSVRAIWYLWEGRAFWWLTGGWSRLGQLLERDPRAEFDEVKELGRLDSATRTAEQTATALFWADGSISQWNRALQRIAIDHGLGLADAARLFALGSVAGADSAIGCWEAKYYYTWWRPIHAITRADTDGNPATGADPAWEPLLSPTPNHPEYPSGHACYAAALTTSLAAFFGRDSVSWNLNSTTSGQTRYYRHFSEALREVINARVWAGIHFRSSDVEGAQLGRRVARWVLKYHFQPTTDNDATPSMMRGG